MEPSNIHHYFLFLYNSGKIPEEAKSAFLCSRTGQDDKPRSGRSKDIVDEELQKLLNEDVT